MSNYIEHLYVHIPFCVSKCPYCDFFSVSTASQHDKDLYTTAIIKEFNFHLYELSRPLRSLYFGGGSPLLLGLTNLKKILTKTEPLLNENTEITIELNPEHASLDVINETSINRVSIGIQTTVPSISKLICRGHDHKRLLSFVNALKKKGVNISFDFMFALPDQELHDLQKDINFVKKLTPEHVSMYLFTPPRKYGSKGSLPSENIIEQMFSMTHHELVNAGYEHYEVSNYAIKNKESVHNMAYWQKRSYLGLGAGAHSFNKEKGIRSWHIKDIAKYLYNPIHVEYELIDKEMAYTETIMLGLRMLNKGIKRAEFKDDRFELLIKKGLLVDHNDNITVPANAIPILDSIIKELTY